MAKQSKRVAALNAKVDRNKLYPLADALTLVKETATAKFDESVDAVINLGIDARKSDQLVRGAIVLPKGTGKTKRVAVFAQGAAAEAAKAAGADIVGFDDLAVGWGFGNSESSIQVFSGGNSVGEEPMAEPEAPVDGVSYPFTFSDHQLISGRGDYNRDGYADLVAATNASSTEPVRIHVLVGAKQVASTFTETIIDEPCGQPQWLSDPSDFDGDGASDWALVCSGKTAQTRRFGILLGGTKSAGALSNVWTTALPLMTTTPFMDFDGDDAPEFLLSITGANAAIWQPGVSDPNAPARYMRYAANSFVDTADHNGDGRLDLVFGSYDTTPARAGSSTSFNVVPTNLAKPADAEKEVQLAF